VGDYADAFGNFHGFVWDDGIFSSFDVPFASVVTTAITHMNNVGQSIGIYSDTDGNIRGFLYDNGVFTDLPNHPNAYFTNATDINDHGQIVGYYTGEDGLLHGFLLENGVFSTVDAPFPGVIHTIVSGINNRGQVVGRFLTSSPGDSPNPYSSHGFIATPSEHLKLIARLEKKLGDMP
jgi:probable HAF family extracellular repeat protein